MVGSIGILGDGAIGKSSAVRLLKHRSYIIEKVMDLSCFWIWQSSTKKQIGFQYTHTQTHRHTHITNSHRL
jgi:hypothetical protein